MRLHTFLVVLAALATPSLVAADSESIRSLNQGLRDATARKIPPSIETLSLRATLLREAIRQNPAAARSLLLQPAELSLLGQRSAAAKSFLETPATFVAEDVTVVDSSDWRTSWYVYSISTPEGPLKAYQDSQDGATPTCNIRMRIEGFRIGDTMLVTNSSIVGKVEHPSCSTLGDQKSAVILVSFPKTAISKLTVEQYKSTFFSAAAPSVSDFYREMSYGKASVSGDVFGPFIVSRDYDSCKDSDTVAAEALALADASTDLTPYNRIFIIAPPPTTCGFGGYGNVGCATYQLAKAGPLRLSRVYEFDAAATEILRVAPHELGHGLGLSHARTDSVGNEPLGPDRTRMTYVEYGDNYSSMGGSGPHHFAGPHKVTLQWLDDDESAIVSNDQTSDLLPMASSTHGLKTIKVERRIGSKQYVWIEYRTPINYDSSLAPGLIGGALVHFEDPGTGGYTELLNFGASFVTAELRAGAIWHDPYSDLTIQVIEATPDRLRVAVRHDPLCTAATFPSTNSYSSDSFSLVASVTPSTCDLSVTGNNFWLQPQPFTAGGSVVNFDAASNDDPVARTGSVTVGRQTFFLRQSPPARPLTLAYFGPVQATATTTPFEIGVVLPNGTATTGSLDILWNVSASFAGGCSISYDYATQVTRMYNDSGVPGPSLSGNPACTVTGIRDSRTTPFFSNFFVTWAPKVTPAQALNVFYRFRSAPDAAPGDWQQVGTVAPVQCLISADTPLVTPSSSGGIAFVNVKAPTGCAWQVSSDAPWITAEPGSGTGAARVTVTVEANQSAAPRSGTLNIGSLALPVQQFSALAAGQPYVSFTQSELDVPRVASTANLQFSTSLRDGGILWKSTSPWLRVNSYSISPAGCPCVVVAWDSNLSNSPRQATLTPALADGTPIPGASLHIVQVSGQPSSADYQFTTAVGADTNADGIPALATVLRQPYGLAVDANGGVIIAEFDGHRFRRLAPDGTISTLAGTGVASSTPNTGSPQQIGTWQPFTASVDGAGNVYLLSNDQIRILHPDGTISVFAGSGAQGFSGDGGPATRAAVLFPIAAAISSDNTVYFTDQGNQRIRKVSPEGIITTIAGTGTAGFTGDDGPATEARINTPFGIVVAPDGSVLFSDRSNHRIRRIATDGTITTMAGTGTCGTAGDGGPAAKAQLCAPAQLVMDADGNLIIADSSNARVRKISPDGVLTTIAGNGSQVTANASGPATKTAIGTPYGVALAPSGELYIADVSNNRVLLLRDGAISVVAGVSNLGGAGDGGSALSADLYRPYGMVFDAAGNLYISDNATHHVRKVAPDGSVSTFAGTGVNGVNGDGRAAVTAAVSTPNGIAAAADGSVFIATSCAIRKVDTAGIISTFAGSTTCGYADSDTASKAQFSTLAGLAIDATGNLYVADPNNQRVRKVTPSGAVTTVAGNGKTGIPVDGAATDSPMNSPSDVAVDVTGNLYIADKASYSVRKVTPDGTISTFAGFPRSFGYSGDTGPADHARFGNIQGVKFDAAGNLWVTDVSYHVVRKVTPDGVVTTVAGTGSAGTASGDGPAWASPLNIPYALAPGPNGIYVSDSANGRVRLLFK